MVGKTDDCTGKSPSIPLALGTAQWSGVYGSNYGINNSAGTPEPHTAQELLAIASRAGVATLDTARGYGDSEALIGASLRDGDCADAFKVVTKLHPGIAPDGINTARALVNTGRSLSASREALGRQVLDVVLLHRYRHLRACDGALWRRLRREREMGAIGALGVSAANPTEAWAALEHPEVEVLQVAASLLDQRLARKGFFEAAQEAGKHIYVRSVFLQGLAFIAPRNLPRRLRAFAQPLGEIRGLSIALQCNIEDLFLGYAATLPGCTPVVGCETVDQLRGILAAASGSSPSLESLHRLAHRITPLPAHLLDPSRWSEPSAAAAVKAPAANSAAGFPGEGRLAANSG
ncbi:MAG: aldo/keto reductase [bacterium]|nr:aldo/keto reductase [bacterium]